MLHLLGDRTQCRGPALEIVSTGLVEPQRYVTSNLVQSMVPLVQVRHGYPSVPSGCRKYRKYRKLGAPFNFGISGISGRH
jgi:hypothetical protein